MKYDVSLDKTTYVGIEGEDEDGIKQRIREITAHGVSKLVLI